MKLAKANKNKSSSANKYWKPNAPGMQEYNRTIFELLAEAMQRRKEEEHRSQPWTWKQNDAAPTTPGNAKNDEQ